MEEYIQETGRAGHDGELASADEGKQGHHASKEMKAYIANKLYCRKRMLYDQDFLGFKLCDINNGHCNCCAVCASVCKCSTCM